jgi:hypothetical protein
MIGVVDKLIADCTGGVQRIAPAPVQRAAPQEPS